MSQYGLPYQGSKSKIAEKICKLFPKAEKFYDLFGGGFAITHCMLKTRSRDFKQFHFNEIRPGITKMINDAICGKYNYNVYKPEWVSREDFFANKEVDIYKKITWSFGNNGKDYLFGKEIEQQKRSMHNAIVFNVFDQYAKDFFGFDKFKEGYDIKTRRLFCKQRIKHLENGRCDLQQLQRLEHLQQLEHLERLEHLQQLEHLERLERLNFYNNDYSEVEIKENSVIYCDIPYAGTVEYDDGFDHKRFYKWAEQVNQPLFVSEFNIEKPFLKLIATIEKRGLIGGAKQKERKLEKVYCNKAALDLIVRR